MKKRCVISQALQFAFGSSAGCNYNYALQKEAEDRQGVNFYLSSEPQIAQTSQLGAITLRLSH